MKYLYSITIIVFLPIALSACSTTKVNPWERDNLARPEMSWEPDAVHASFKNHTYFSKEAATDRVSTSGSGCGCN